MNEDTPLITVETEAPGPIMLRDKLIDLKEKLITESAIVEKMIQKCIDGLEKNDNGAFIQVADSLEHTVNDMETLIDKLCTVTIALYHPEAKDLRTLLMVFKMNGNLERMADLTVNISRSGLFLIERPPLLPFLDLPKIARAAQTMVKDSISAFIDEDAELALSVCRRDSQVDLLNAQFFRQLMGFMHSDPTTIERALHLSRVSHNFERIADLSTNIAEESIYITDGRVIRHRAKDLKTA